jgi:hypothetical protein
MYFQFSIKMPLGLGVTKISISGECRVIVAEIRYRKRRGQRKEKLHF